MSYSSEVLADGPVAYYRMDESSGQPQDFSGYGNNTTVTGGTPTYGQPGALPSDPTSTSIFLDGTTNYFSAPNDSSLDLGDTLTAEAWIYRFGGLATSHTVVDKGSNAYRLFLDDGTDLFGAVKSGGATIVKSTATIGTFGVWYHIAWTKAGATNHLYLNGVDVTGVVTDQTLADAGSALFIGVSNDLTFYLDTRIDEVAVYPTALSAARVLAHYNAAITGAPSDNPPIGFHGRGAGW